MAGPDGWHLVEDDRLSQARLMRLLYETFGPGEFFGNVNISGCLGLPKELLKSEDLPRLLSRLQGEGFSLRVGSLPLAVAAWEFTLDATNSSLDWFELHPEIRCDGELLSADELRGLLNGGMLERNGRLILPDRESARVLAMIGGCLPSRKGKRDTKGDAVRVPRLQILDWLELRNHGVSVKLAPHDACVLDNLLDFAGIPERALPAGLDATMRHYQTDSYRWLGFLYEHRFGACLADDMGLGKTVQGIALPSRRR